MSYYKAVAYLYAGFQAEESQKMGERIAYYQAAADKLTESSKTAGPSYAKECLVFTNGRDSGKVGQR